MNAIARAARRRDGARVVGNDAAHLGQAAGRGLPPLARVIKGRRCEEQEERTDKVNTAQAVRQLEGRLQTRSRRSGCE